MSALSLFTGGKQMKSKDKSQEEISAETWTANQALKADDEQAGGE